MTGTFSALGKQVLIDGKHHYADAADPKAAEFIAEACNAKAVGGWQPIETAPRDGTWIMLFAERAEPSVSFGYYDDQPFMPDDDEPWGWAFIEADGMPSRVAPTHWMPLPAAPVSA